MLFLRSKTIELSSIKVFIFIWSTSFCFVFEKADWWSLGFWRALALSGESPLSRPISQPGSSGDFYTTKSRNSLVTIPALLIVVNAPPSVVMIFFAMIRSISVSISAARTSAWGYRNDMECVFPAVSVLNTSCRFKDVVSAICLSSSL